MAKIVINPITGSYATVPALNARLQQIEDALNNDILWRDGFVAEPNQMEVDLDMSGNSILNSTIDVGTTSVAAVTFVQNGVLVTDLSDQWYLGGKAAHPTLLNDGVTTIDASHEGVTYYNTVANLLYSWDGAAWISATASASSNAEDVVLADVGGNYTAIDVEAAFAELASTDGAAIVKIEDTDSRFVAADVEGALKESLINYLPEVEKTLGVSSITISGIPTNARKVTFTFRDIQILGTSNVSLWVLPNSGSPGSIDEGRADVTGVNTCTASTNTSSNTISMAYQVDVGDVWHGNVTFTKVSATVWAIQGFAMDTVNSHVEISGGIATGLGNIPNITLGTNVATFGTGFIGVSYEV